MKDGMLVIDKPKGVTSHDMVVRTRRFFNIKKVGHIGTLDPLATGVLPLLMGEATKISPFLMKQEKEYIATMKFGEETDTLDSEGKVLYKENVEDFDEERAVEAVKRFKGWMEQVPPVYSAIKKGGVPLYRLARKGIEVKVEPRKVEIKEIEILKLSLPYLTFRAVCSSGTYIRALCRDIGRESGWRGYLTALRRVRSGDFSLNECVDLKNLDDHNIDFVKEQVIPMGALLKGVPSLEVERSVEDRIRRGCHPKWEDLRYPDRLRFRIGKKVKLMSKDGRLISIAEVKNGKEDIGENPVMMNSEALKYSDVTFKLLRVFN